MRTTGTALIPANRITDPASPTTLGAGDLLAVALGLLLVLFAAFWPRK